VVQAAGIRRPAAPNRPPLEDFDLRSLHASFALVRQGAFCISIDLELAWGFWDRPSREYDRLCAEKERAIVRALLDLFATHEVPATWAIVGRLLDRSDTLPPTREHLWYAPDLVEAIRHASPRHDVGSHGFAHVYFRESGRDTLRADLRCARRVHDDHGLDFTSFVFPRNQVAHLDLLCEAGIRVFRGTNAGWETTVREKLGETLGRAANLADKLLPTAPAVVLPRPHPSGLVELPASMSLLGRGGLRRLVRPDVARTKARLGLHRAIREGAVFHLWFHPSNFYWETDVQLRVLEGILDEACTLRDRDALEVRTMASYAAHRPAMTAPSTGGIHDATA
jgi:peptidoglycan/xylan/chitin deacetylase (PgdA/CDA1 family)